jgi:hypothetical protein
MVAADSLAMYLHIFQDRLGCISHGHQEGAFQTAGKGFQSTYSEIQTCCNVVQSNCVDSGLGGILGGRSWGSRHVGIYPVVPWEFGTGYKYPAHNAHEL